MGSTVTSEQKGPDPKMSLSPGPFGVQLTCYAMPKRVQRDAVRLMRNAKLSNDMFDFINTKQCLNLNEQIRSVSGNKGSFAL